ncbi:hypothetical protein LMxysn_0446 [Listeria monocytogenes]|nr:hypothetical protein LMxysn_0446 [Listeria monocytogenes]
MVALTDEAKANPYGYAGYTYDKEIEQYYLMARYYEPEQGVFTAYDPDPGDEDDPQTMNGYNYANNNPVMMIDPDGNWAALVLRLGLKGGKYVWKYGKKGAKWIGKTAKKGAKWVGKTAKKAWEKVPYKIQKIGRIKASGDKGKGYWGIRYSKKKMGERLIEVGSFILLIMDMGGIYREIIIRSIMGNGGDLVKELNV